MASATPDLRRDLPVATLAEQYRDVRGTTERYCRTLAPEDCVVQSMPDVSPTKWHLAHVSWFFEQFLLGHFDADYRPFNAQFHFLFNSYYYSVGDMHARPRRGLLSRPTVDEILRYREHVDAAMLDLIDREDGNPALAERVQLGLNHEQQHQELLLTDIKHVLSQNPLKPAMNPQLPTPPSTAPATMRFIDCPSGLQQIGNTGDDGFCFDNETPRHDVHVAPARVADRLVTNGEFLEFIRDGGYREARLWLSDGWTAVNERGWNRPLYWSEDLEQAFTLGGMREIDRHAPVTHISYYEADAFARWADARLPGEAEWELVARDEPVTGNLADSGYWQPAAGAGQWYGDTWEWTASPYTAYPGFRPLAGSLGEYNGKFMCNQLSVRGGSCVTSAGHVRPTYRSFFYPDARWQFLGLRLARDEEGGRNG